MANNTTSLQTKIGCTGGAWLCVFVFGVLIYGIITKNFVSDGVFFSMVGAVFVLVIIGVIGMQNDSIRGLEQKFNLKKGDIVYIGTFFSGDVQVDFQSFRGILSDEETRKLLPSMLKDASIHAAVSKDKLHLFYVTKNGTEMMFLRDILLSDLVQVVSNDRRYTEEKYWGNVEYKNPIFPNFRHHRAVYHTIKKGAIWLEIYWQEQGENKKLFCIMDNDFVRKKVTDTILTDIHKNTDSTMEQT